MNTQNISSAFAQHPKLWKVNDAWLDDSSGKLERTHSSLTELTVEQWGCYPFDNADIPQDMLQFVTQFLIRLRFSKPVSCDLEEMCRMILTRIDYHDPYFFLIDTLIKPSHNELNHTYRDRKTGDILDATKIETFELDLEWKFTPFMAIGHLFRTHSLFTQNRWGDEKALVDFLKETCRAVWGDWEGYTKYFIDDVIEEYRQYEIFEGDNSSDPSHVSLAVQNLENEKWHWHAVGLGVAAWIKSQNALPWLVTYHPVYDSLLKLNDDFTVTPWPRSGNEAVIDGTSIYTHEHLEVLSGRKPDACACCGAEAHCTQYLNMTALFNPVCSCGGLIDPMDTACVYGTHNTRSCQPYKAKHQIRLGYVCQRCIWVSANRLETHTKCGRTICPAVNCQHHLGVGARMQALTKQRTMQLTSSQCG